jgi:hypothetical protein
MPIEFPLAAGCPMTNAIEARDQLVGAPQLGEDGEDARIRA